MSKPIAFVDGALVPRRDAVVSIDDAAVRYGAACFETMRAAHGRVFRLDAHLNRLRAGLEAMHVEAPPASALSEAVSRTLEANGLTEARVRLSVSAGRMPGPDLAAAGAPSVIVVADPLSADTPPPVTLAVSALRVDAGRPLAFAKTSQYLVYLLARAEARAGGADDALLLSSADEVCETAAANLFAVIDGALVTPSLTSGPLPGITRDVLLEIAGCTRIEAVERPIPLVELDDASEIFVTNSVVGVQPVRSIVRDAVPLWTAADGVDEVTARLAGEYALLLEAECGEGQSDG